MTKIELEKYRKRERAIMAALQSKTLSKVAEDFGMTYQRIQQIRDRVEKRNGKK